MSATALPTAKPPWAVTAWCDHNYIYVEMPCKDAPPYIIKEPLSEGGLGRALGLMRRLYVAEAPRPTTAEKADYTKDHPKIRKVTQAVAAKGFSEEARLSVRDVLRKRGIL